MCFAVIVAAAAEAIILIAMFKTKKQAGVEPAC